MTKSDLERALRLLPHGSEFRFVDRLVSLEPGRAGQGEYEVRGGEAFLRGHFPGDPLMPGVLLVEAIAQLAGIVAQSDPAITPLLRLKLTALRGVKILGASRPGDIVSLDARVTGRLANLVQASGEARIGEKLLVAADLTLSGEFQADA